MDATNAMSQSKKLEALEALMAKNQILEIEEICKTLDVSSRMSAYRYLKQLDYIVSYSHGGMYYALRENANFNQDCLWHRGDIGFSKYGTLINTITYLVETSEAGKTNDELTSQFKLRVQNALLQLTNDNKISREKFDRIYLYISKDPAKGKQQLEKRQFKMFEKPISDWVVIEVLVEAIRSSHEFVNASTVSSRLRKRGSSITPNQVRQVFLIHSLEKKTRD